MTPGSSPGGALDTLTAAAEEATGRYPGRWSVIGDTNSAGVTHDEHWGDLGVNGVDPSLAYFIAAADPPTVLALVAVARAAEAYVASREAEDTTSVGLLEAWSALRRAVAALTRADSGQT